VSNEAEKSAGNGRQPPARLLIVDDDARIRNAFGSVFSREPDLEVTAQSRNTLEAASLCRELQPNLALVDLRTPIAGACEIIEELKAECPKLCILAIVDEVDEDALLRVVKCGVSGYVLKESAPTELLTAVRMALAGKMPLNRELAMRLLRRLAGDASRERIGSSTPESASTEPADKNKMVFTPRELEVLTRLAAGKTNRQIAQELHVSLSTVKRHMERILPKLGVADRTHAAVTALQLGLLPPRKDR
jgi:DNA-binding NarL/FixJ family response regulator